MLKVYLSKQSLCSTDIIHIYVYILEFDLSLDRDRACRNSQVKVQRSKVDMISKFRHSVGI